MSRAPFTASEYRRAFEALGARVSEGQRRMLALHAAAPGRLLDVLALARAAGSAWPNYTYAHYGRLGHDIARVLGHSQNERVWTRVLGVDSRDPTTGLIRWRLHREAAVAAREMGWRDSLVRPDALSEVGDAASQLQALPETVREALIEARLGQGAFRQQLISRWRACSVTGCGILEALRASHIKPWRACMDHERLDPDNGLLLIATLDALFDAGLISFGDAGALLISSALPRRDWPSLGLRPKMRLRRVFPGSVPYLAHHRSTVFAPGA